MDDDLFLPPPDPTEADWAEYERSGFEPLFFDWYKFTGAVLNVLSAIEPNSPAFRCSDSRHYYVLSGLMHRCVRLMLANVHLSHEGSFGETAAIVDRCLCESAIRIQWLCNQNSPDRILRFLRDSLRPELEFELKIQAKIAERNGTVLPIEKRMLASIENHIAAAGVTRDEIRQSKRLPNFSQMLDNLGFERLEYVVVQGMGSHHIHGTWPSLLSHYLTKNDPVPGFEFRPRHNPVSMHINQYVHGCRFVLNAAISYSRFFLDDEEAANFEYLCADTLEEIIRHYERSIAAGA